MTGHVLLGVGGGIAAFKAAALASQLVQRGRRVRVAMTAAAGQFVGELTFAALTGSTVLTSPTQLDADGGAAHVAAARDAALLIVAPTTADLLARLAAGFCDDAVSLLAVTCRCPKLLCPAMNDAMWESSVVQRNLRTVGELGFRLLGPVHGRLAEGYAAIGRMVEPDAILAEVESLLGPVRGLGGAG